MRSGEWPDANAALEALNEMRESRYQARPTFTILFSVGGRARRRAT